MFHFNLFGKKKQKNSETPHDTIKALEETITTLEKRETHLQHLSAKYKAEAKKVVKTDKSRAITLLRKVQVNEKQLNSIQKQLQTLETQVIAIQEGVMNKGTIASLSKGRDALQEMANTLNVDKVDELMDDISEQLEATSEISNSLAQPLCYNDDDGDEELLRKFEEEETVGETVGERSEQSEEKEGCEGGEEEDEIVEELNSMKVPTGKVIIVDNEEEEELRQLFRTMDIL